MEVIQWRIVRDGKGEMMDREITTCESGKKNKRQRVEQSNLGMKVREKSGME